MREPLAAEGAMVVPMMAAQLQDLALAEEQLLERLRSLVGTLEARTAQLHALGVFTEYAAIHRAYCVLAEGGSLEALKRALFLQWLSRVEPPFLSGMLDLDHEAERRTGALVERLCASSSVDAELGWMLPYYSSIADWALPPAEDCPQLAAFCEANASDDIGRCVANAELEGRGQLGDYWRSIRRAAPSP